MEIQKVNNISSTTLTNDKVSISKSTNEPAVNPFKTQDSTIAKDNTVNSVNPFDQKTFSPIDASEKARREMLNYFKNTFANTDEFKKVFGEKATWDDIADAVIARIAVHRDKKCEMERYEGKAYCFNIELDGLSGEVSLDKKTGAVKAIKVDAD